METHFIKIIETAVVVVLLIVTHLFTRRSINSMLKKIHFTLQRRKLTLRMINLLLTIAAIVFISAIWGVKQTDIVVFISSVMAILGIAFVAQWSLLSNITAGLILFFNHPLRIGDHIKIIEKDFIIEGIVNDITFFFIHIKTTEREKITLSNTIVLQKTISIVPNPENETLKKVENNR
ncbi:MAG TPA: mechanosensitive ion channel [Draconibacterium sp.]|nr:mechanosensitive ion channel [Draconibacterium sp.]